MLTLEKNALLYPLAIEVVYKQHGDAANDNKLQQGVVSHFGKTLYNACMATYPCNVIHFLRDKP